MSYSDRMTLTLNEACAKKNEPASHIFSPQLNVSKNYIYTYEGQTQFLGVFLKPVLLVWYHLDSDGLHATIITPQEAKELEQRISHLEASWIASTEDSVVAGTRPIKMLTDPQYQSLKEQIRFVNGEFNSLLNQETPLQWLTEEPIEKLRFFSEQLMALRPGSAPGFRQLQTAMTQAKTEGFDYISARPFEDLSQFNWKTIFPKTFPNQARDYQKLAEAFVYLNQNWTHSSPSIDHLQQQFDLPINSLAALAKHLKHLLSLKELLTHLHSAETKKPFLLKLTEEQKFCLEQCINIDISRLRTTHSARLNKVNEQHELQLASIQALSILTLYPALKDNKALFNPYFETQAKQADFKELLLALLELPNPSLLLLQNILNNPQADAEIINKLLEQNHALDSNLLVAIAPKCQNEAQIDRLLQQIYLNEEGVLALLQNPQLTARQLNKLFNYIEKESSLLLIAQHPATNQESYTELLQHLALTDQGLLQLLNKRSFNKQEVLLILKHPLALASEVIQELLKQQSSDEDVLLMLLPRAPQEVLYDLIHHAQFTERVAEELIKQAPRKPNILGELALKIFAQLRANPNSHWERCFDNLLILMQKTHKTHELLPLLQEKQAELTPKLALKIIALGGEQLFNQLPLARLIAEANELELDFFTKVKNAFSPTQLKTLVDKVNRVEHIDRVLKRKEMSPELGTILFNKSNYDGKMGPWLPWLNTEQIVKILPKAPDYSSLSYGLRHLQLRPEVREQWLEQSLTKQKERWQNTTHKTPQQSLMNLLEDLKIKAYQHAVQAVKKPHYNDAAETAFSLYQALHAKAIRYFNSPRDYPRFRSECEAEIQAARDILAVHRGYKQLLLDIVNVLLSVVSLLINNDWRFFKSNTASLELVDNISKNLLLSH
ncbi:hypothetical protein [Legionella sp. km772]|uniref:hypothetical protein n=1 Tax=Legionella sp. km772 TaxID=2498111 RepID=UPI000F8F669F|nr:hypothetical protein [Legionella sp. km772]RUR08136.1 hypothetical protein ELY15_11425 [Legionella sp. km772]